MTNHILCSSQRPGRDEKKIAQAFTPGLSIVQLDRRKSGRGLPHSKTLRTKWPVGIRDSVVECGSPLPLSTLVRNTQVTAT